MSQATERFIDMVHSTVFEELPTFRMDRNGNNVPISGGGHGVDLPASISINETFWIKNGVI